MRGNALLAQEFQTEPAAEAANDLWEARLFIGENHVHQASGGVTLLASTLTGTASITSLGLGLLNIILINEQYFGLPHIAEPGLASPSMPVSIDKITELVFISIHFRKAISEGRLRQALVFAKNPYRRTPYDRWLQEAGLRPIVLTTPDFAHEYSHLETHVFSNFDQNSNVDRVAMSLVRERNIEVVVARAESDILRAAHLRTRTELKGQHLESARHFRDKGLMRQIAASSGIRVPQFRLVDDVFSLLGFIERVGYPVVVKPRSEGGSTGVEVISSPSELEACLESRLVTNLIVEEFVQGTMYHVDGLVAGGELRFLYPFQYVNGCLAYRNDEFAGTFTLAPRNKHFDALVSCARRTLEALPTPRDTTFHCEIWINPQGEAVLCEIASRSGGAMIVPTIEHAFGFNIDHQWVRAQAGLSVNVSQTLGTLAGGVIVPPRKGVLTSVPNDAAPPYVKKIDRTGVIGKTYLGGAKSGTFISGYVVEGKDEHEVETRMHEAAAWNDAHTTWNSL